MGGAIASWEWDRWRNRLREKFPMSPIGRSGALSEARDRSSEAADNAGEVISTLRNAVTEAARSPTGHDRAPVDRGGFPARRDVEIWTLTESPAAVCACS